MLAFRVLPGNKGFCTAQHFCDYRKRSDVADVACAATSRREICILVSGVASGVLASKASAAQPEQARLSIEEVEKRLIDCFQLGQYYVSGEMDRGIFEPNCLFTDPTVRVQGTERYAKAVAEIFGRERSTVDLITCEVAGPNTILVSWRLDGALRQGSREFRFKPYTGKTVYTTDAVSGKIVRQEETWDTSIADVFISIFIPSFGVPPAPPAEVLRQRAAAGKTAG